MSFFVYILELRDGHFYVGSTDDLTRRLKEHKEGRGGRTTRITGLKRLLYSEEQASRSAAERRELQLKGWSRAKKLALIKGDRVRLHRLAKRGG
ncbi:MAG: GIY-YIG nuclease family protein [Candidatus Coatesbacteria bacterium]